MLRPFISSNFVEEGLPLTSSGTFSEDFATQGELFKHASLIEWPRNFSCLSLIVCKSLRSICTLVKTSVWDSIEVEIRSIFAKYTHTNGREIYGSVSVVQFHYLVCELTECMIAGLCILY